MFILENGQIYFQDEFVKYIYGAPENVETVRLDSETVEDVFYTFDLELGEYVEQSRTERAEPLPPTPPTDAEKIALLEQQLAQTNQDLAAVLEMILG